MKKKVIICMILIICVITVGIGVTIFCINKNKNKDSEKNENIIVEQDNNKNNSEEISRNSSKLDIKISNINSWNENNINCEQYSVELTNKSNEVIKNWKVVLLNVSSDLAISQIWNAKYIIENNNLVITPESYNDSIEENGKIEIGFIAKTSNKINIENYKVFIGDEEMINDNNTINNPVENNNESTENTENTPKEEKKLSIDGTPVQQHGRLSVQGTNLVDSKGEKFQLRGVSTHSIAAFPQYVNKDTFKEMRDVWGINVVRIAMYSNPNDGYSIKQHEKVKEAVKYASDLGLYVIIDWHILFDNNPNIYKNEAIAFFKEMATEYKDYENVLYEICNEPNGNVTWKRDVKPYAEEVISEIRKIDSKSIIIVGTPTWSQDVDIVADDRIEGQSNIMYTLHFYAATHKDNLRAKLKTAVDKGLPIFVTEFGISDASGNGTIDENEGNKWIDTLNNYNISWVCWNLSNKNETSAILSSSCKKTSGFEEQDFSGEGKWLLKKLKE